jgi:hypothetical protein
MTSIEQKRKVNDKDKWLDELIKKTELIQNVDNDGSSC